MTVTSSRRISQPAAVTRLTIGWRGQEPPSLRTHVGRYGPMPSRPQAGELIEAVTRAGLTGRGGAGFPAGVKMQSVAARRGPAVVVANGLESEPASDKDEALLSRAPHLVIDGATQAACAVGAGEVHLVVPASRPWLAGILHGALAERARAGIDQVPVYVHRLPGGYVSSSETAVVQWLNGGPAKPTLTPPRPFERGVGRRPTLISNVETFAHVGLIARYGAAWFREVGSPDAPGTMLVTMSGAISAPGVYEIEAGRTVGAILALGGVDPQARSVLIGGYFGTWAPLPEAADTPLTSAGLKPLGAAPGAGVLLALPPGTCGLAETARVLAWLAGQSAGQCGPCRFGLPAIADDFAQLAGGRTDGPVLRRLGRRLETVAGRGACAHPDGAVRLAQSALTEFAADVAAHADGRPCLNWRPGRDRPSVLPVPGYRGTDRPS
jgi:NADH:ubiquinone oxidoreductase subunit F (NADH-binding)